MGLCVLICSNNLVPTNVCKDKNRRRNSHELLYGVKFANEKEHGKRHKPRSHSVVGTNIDSRDNKCISADVDNIDDTHIYCEDRLRLSSPTGASLPKPKIFCIEKSNVIILPTLEGEDYSRIEDITDANQKEPCGDKRCEDIDYDLLNDYTDSKTKVDFEVHKKDFILKQDILETNNAVCGVIGGENITSHLPVVDHTDLNRNKIVLGNNSRLNSTII